MTPEEAARFILSDGQDSALKSLNHRELEIAFAEAMKDPEFQARWKRGLQEMADRIDAEIADEVYRAYRL
jgi:hypothetical protein